MRWNSLNRAKISQSLTHGYVAILLLRSLKAFHRRSSYSQATPWNLFSLYRSFVFADMYTHGGIYNSHTAYKMEFFFPLRVRSLNFLRFPSHWASKARRLASQRPPFFSVRFLRVVRVRGLCDQGSVETDIALSTTGRQLTSNVADSPAETA